MTIELTPYEKNDLVRLLDYAADQKQLDYEYGKITELAYKDFVDKLIILRKRIDGIKPDVRIVQKSILSELIE